MKRKTDIDMYDQVLGFLYKNQEDQAIVIIGKSEFNLEITDSDGRTLLHHAIIDNSYKIAEALLIKGVSSSCSDKRGWTPLHFAAQNNNIETTKLLLSYNPTIDAKDEYGNNVIWRATYAFKGVGELIKLLLANGANPNLTNNNNVSAIDLANRIGKDSLIELFN